jgi:selenocysteine lyase/cysteine desulfurase
MSPINRRNFMKTTAALGLTSLPSARKSLALSTEQDPLGVRDDFHVTRNFAYLNISLVGPMPTVVHNAAITYADKQRLNPAASYFESRRIKEQVRIKFANLFGANANEISLLFSTSDAENIVTDSLDLKPGDNVVVDELHFATTFVLYRNLEATKGIELRIVPHVNGQARIEDFEARVDARTRMISVAWVSNRNGYRHDLKSLAKLAHHHGGYLFADGIQCFGTFPVNLHDLGVDFACGNSYKYLLSSWGAAPFYVREEHLNLITPDRFGHNQVAKNLPDFHFELEQTAAKYEHAGLIYGTVAQLGAALGFIGEVGLDRIEKHTVGLAQNLRNGIADLGYEMFTPSNNPSHIMSFWHGRDTDKIQRALEEERVSITFQESGALIRASVGMYNNQDDVARLLKVLAKLA